MRYKNKLFIIIIIIIVQSDLENCAYLWKNPGYAPGLSIFSWFSQFLSVCRK